jgi:glycosyltransferase involved in cell wall biosynthesis
MTKVTIVTATFNRAHFLMRVWKSIKNQDADFEWLVVDNDFSKDNTAEIVRGFADPRVRYVGGVAGRSGANAARNIGAAMASGCYVVFLDDDDELAPEALKSMVEALDAAPDHVGVAGFGCVLAGHSAEAAKYPPPEIYGEEDFLSGRVPHGERIYIFRKEIFAHFSLPEDLPLSEGIFIFEVSKKFSYLISGKIARIYHLHDSNASVGKFIVDRSKHIGRNFERIIANHEEVLATHPQARGRFLKKALFRYSVARAHRDGWRVLRAVAASGRLWDTLTALAIYLLGLSTLAARLEPSRLRLQRLIGELR